MSIDILFKIASVGIIVTILNQLLTRWGREDIAMVSTVVGLIIVLLMAINTVESFFSTIKSAFQLY